jgi:tetratricopeptide (TPR) repeat protein
MLKAQLAMGRFAEARKQRLRLSKREAAEERKLLILVDGILAALDQDFDQALDLFTLAGADWHLCPNLEGIVGYVLFRHQRYEDARNVFRVAMHSPWGAVQEFGVLGLAECHLALGQWAEAEPLYESLAGTGSPLGLIGLAEFQVRQGKVKEARANLTDLATTANQDYWKGVALAYLMSLRSKPEEWAESLLLAQRAQALVLSRPWKETLSEMTLRSVRCGIGSLWDSDAHEELLILAEKWRRYQHELPQDTQMLIGKAYEEAGLYGAALEVYSRLSDDPNALFRGARLAWRCEKYQEAQSLLEAYLSSDGKTHKSDAKLLLACVYARRDRLDRAKECLRGMGSIRDPSLWIALGEVEASMGMVDLAIDHLKTALGEASISETERRHLLYMLGVLNYRRGSYKEALRYFRLGKEGGKPGQGVVAEPIEILCLARLDKFESARGQLEKLPKGPEADVVKAILDAEDLARSLQKHGHAF